MVLQYLPADYVYCLFVIVVDRADDSQELLGVCLPDLSM